MSSSVTIFLTSHLNGLFSDYFSPVATILLKIVAWVLMMLVFTIFYLIMPNTKVELKAAFVSGLITGVIFEIWQWIFVTFLLGAVNYGAVYGSFAALPLFLVWLQTSWIIVLVGCELAYSIQNVNRYATEYYSENISMRLQKRLALLIMTKITESFRNEEKPKDSSAWSQELQISQKLFMYMTGRLQESGLLVEIKDESSMNPVFIPGVETGKITTAEIFSRLESLGKDKDFPIKISGDFQKIEEICTEMEKKIYETVL